jgi:hypothetical protein
MNIYREYLRQKFIATKDELISSIKNNTSDIVAASSGLLLVLDIFILGIGLTIFNNDHRLSGNPSSYRYALNEINFILILGFICAGLVFAGVGYLIVSSIYNSFKKDTDNIKKYGVINPNLEDEKVKNDDLFFDDDLDEDLPEDIDLDVYKVYKVYKDNK